MRNLFLLLLLCRIFIYDTEQWARRSDEITEWLLGKTLISMTQSTDSITHQTMIVIVAKT